MDNERPKASIDLSPFNINSLHIEVEYEGHVWEVLKLNLDTGIIEVMGRSEARRGTDGVWRDYYVTYHKPVMFCEIERGWFDPAAMEIGGNQ